MTQSEHPAGRRAPHGPKPRNDSTGPARTRRGDERRPYPTAATTTRVSPAKPTSTGTRSRGSAAATPQPTPATVWTTGDSPIELSTTWPTPIVSQIVRAFSNPGARVVLLPWPTPQSPRTARHPLNVVGPDGGIAHAPGTHPDDEVADALATIESLDRRGCVMRPAAEDAITRPASRPFWADLVDDTAHAPVTASAPPLPTFDSTVLDNPDAVPADTDLIVTSLRPELGSESSGDLVALVAAWMLRVGGILAVLTHGNWPQGELIDPTGSVVASAQNADLLYLQHIVALHVPVRDGRLATELLTDIDSPAAEEHTRATHRAAVRRLPAPHQRIHSDVLVFAQPHEHEPPPVSPPEQPRATGVIR
jgi:hypothetical protein